MKEESYISPARAFVSERCIVNPAARVELDLLWEAWQKWCADQGSTHIGTRQTFGRELREAVPTVRRRRNHVFGSFYQGLELR